MDRGRRTLLLIAAVCIAPVVVSYTVYYLAPDLPTANYGELLSPAPAGETKGTHADGRAFELSELRGKWVLLVVGRSACAESCRRRLYATRQARKLQNLEQPRVVRLFVATDRAALPADVQAEHPDLVVARVAPGALAWLPAAGGQEAHIYLVDPLGNAILRYGDDPDIKRLSKDLGRLLKASRIG